MHDHDLIAGIRTEVPLFNTDTHETEHKVGYTVEPDLKGWAGSSEVRAQFDDGNRTATTILLPSEY